MRHCSVCMCVYCILYTAHIHTAVEWTSLLASAMCGLIDLILKILLALVSCVRDQEAGRCRIISVICDLQPHSHRMYDVYQRCTRFWWVLHYAKSMSAHRHHYHTYALMNMPVLDMFLHKTQRMYARLMQVRVVLLLPFVLVVCVNMNFLNNQRSVQSSPVCIEVNCDNCTFSLIFLIETLTHFLDAVESRTSTNRWTYLKQNRTSTLKLCFQLEQLLPSADG